jgi:hypothetical protein
MFLFNGEEVETGEILRRVPLNKLPFVHGFDLKGI